MNLTKSDFKIARSCPTKLYYKKLKYPSLTDDDAYLEFLADGGYMVETMAKLLFPDGKEMGNWNDAAKAFEETQRGVATGKGTFFEATIIHNGLLARVDILDCQSDGLRLIEVKSSSIDSGEDGPNPFRGKKGGIVSDWRPYLEDVTFQFIVLHRAFPHLRIIPFLCVVDKDKLATENTTFDKFQLRKISDGEPRWRPEVNYVGQIDELRKNHILAIKDVSNEVQELRNEIENAADEFVTTLQSNPIKRIPPKLGQKCKGCEYRLLESRAGNNGFRDCWGALADPDPHALDLYRVDLLGGKNRDVIAEMTKEGHTKLSDVPLELLVGVLRAGDEGLGLGKLKK